MSIRLYYSNLTERLAEKLAANLKDQSASQDPFRTSTIIIPNKNLEQWLKMAIARQNTIATTLDFPFLEKGLWDLLASVDGRDPAAKPTLLSQDAAHLLILAELFSMQPDEKELTLFREYLFDRKGARQPDYYRKAWQLAGKLERSFREYEYNREDLIDAWSAGKPYYKDGSASLKRMEACQRALYQRVFGSGGSRDKLDAAHGKKRLTLPQYERLIFRSGEARAPAKREEGTTVHIFGISQISAFHTRLLFELGRQMDIVLYQLNVCSEFWEDIRTPQEDRYRKFKNIKVKENTAGDYLEEHPRENRLLKLWGKPGRENIKLLSELEEICAGEVRFDSEWTLSDDAAPKRPTVLRAVQDHILHRVEGESYCGKDRISHCHCEESRQGRDDEAISKNDEEIASLPLRAKALAVARNDDGGVRMAQDGSGHSSGMPDHPGPLVQDTSIQIAGAPGIYREVETVYNSIIENMRADPALHLTDIAVLVPNMAAYKAAIQAVFSRDEQSERLVPFNMSDTAASDDSLYASAVLGLLELVDSPFSRRQVFSLILNDCFLAACRATREDALAWLAWADKLNIFHSIDAEDRKRRGYAENDLYTWHQGLQRLRLGRIMETDDDPLTHGEFRRYRDVVPFADRESANAALVSSFCEAVESLIKRLAGLRGAVLSCADWSARLAAVIDEFLAVPKARPEEEKVAVSVRRALGALAGCDDFLRQRGIAAVGLAFPVEYLEAALAKVATTHGKYLSGGVTVSSLLPMRPIPFKVVYIMGLGEGEFPGREDRSTLDLRHYRRRIGDVSTPEANRYLFLETLMSVREKLYCTYISRDTQKDELFHPCSVVNELRGYLDDHILNKPFRTLKDTDAHWQDDIPLKGSSVRYLAKRDAVVAWSDILQNFSVTDRLGCLLEGGRSDAIQLTEKVRAACDVKARSLVAWKKVRGAKPAAPEEDEAGVVERIRLRELATFLANPIEASLERHLGVYDEREEDLLAAEDEPFYSDYPEKRDFSIRMAGQFIIEWQAGGLARTDPARFIEERLGQWYGYCRLQGRTPDEAFGGVDRKKFEAALQERILGEKGLRAFLDARKERTFVRLSVLGEAGSVPGGGTRYDPLILKIGPRGSAREAVVTGSVPFSWRDDGAGEFEVCIPVIRLLKNGTLTREMLQPILYYLSLRSSGALGGKSAPFSLYLAGPDKVSPCGRYDVSKTDAGEYLAMLAGDLVDPSSFDLLPLGLLQSKDMAIDTLTAHPKPKEAREFRTQLEELVTSAADEEFSLYRPSRIVASIDAAVPKDAYEKAYRRITWLVKANML